MFSLIAIMAITVAGGLLGELMNKKNLQGTKGKEGLAAINEKIAVIKRNVAVIRETLTTKALAPNKAAKLQADVERLERDEQTLTASTMSYKIKVCATAVWWT